MPFEVFMSPPVALTIAGSDPSGGAGLQADLKTFHQHRVFGASVVTLLTVQNTQTVSSIHTLDPGFVAEQYEAVVQDLPPAAAKTGAMGNQDLILTVADRLARASFPVVVDPVMISKHQVPLMDESCVAAFTETLLPRAFVVTPNLFEASRLSAIEIRDLASMKDAARSIRAMGPEAVLIKGLRENDQLSDLLLVDEEFYLWTSPWINTRHTHGTGCVLSAAITAHLARGATLQQAVSDARPFVTAAILTAPDLGHGVGPTNLFASIHTTANRGSAAPGTGE
jgi:hydroxymethylpyrimidine/phosphomethylpyrimidine kinase